MRKNGIKDFKWIFYRQNLGKLLKIGFLALVGFFFQKKWGTNKIKSVSTYPWNVKWILLFSNFDFHILSPPPTSMRKGGDNICWISHQYPVLGSRFILRVLTWHAAFIVSLGSEYKRWKKSGHFDRPKRPFARCRLLGKGG